MSRKAVEGQKQSKMTEIENLIKVKTRAKNKNYFQKFLPSLFDQKKVNFLTPKMSILKKSTDII